MLSIFKAVRDNNVDTVRDFVQLASAGASNIIVNTKSNNSDKNKHYGYDLQQKQQHNRQLFQRYAKATGQKQFNINKRSIRGRTALHCAAVWNRTLIAKILIECPLVNINIQDRENGWTALHRALYVGNLEIALLLLQRGDADLTIKDWEGLRPLELVSITLHNFPIPKGVDPKDSLEEQVEADGLKDIVNGISDKETITRSGGTDLYSWGSNTNYLLGHRDSENRTNPEHVHLDHLASQQTSLTTMMQHATVLIQSVKMSKNHMAVLTSESKHNLLLCGFGRGGRLGMGSDLDAQLLLQPVLWPERIIAVALGRDHTIGVSERGSVITFGSNEHGQLGYETEDMQQLVPRKIQAPSLKRQEIVGTAASTIHSVVYTRTELFTFGYNKGQLGYHAGDDVRQVSPRKVAFNNKIKQVVAVEYATAVLLETKEVVLLCNSTQQKIIFPTNRFPSNMQVYSSASTYITKLIHSGDEYLGAISNMGEVYLWTCRPGNTKQGDNKTKHISHQKQTTIISSPKRIWDLKKPHLAATDASLGHHGELIVSTVSGQVFVGNPSKDGYKFCMVPKLQRCIQVCASPSGAFAAIRSEATPKEVYPERSTFADDVLMSLPHIVVSRQLESDINQLDREKKASIELLHQSIDELTMDNSATADDDIFKEKENAIKINHHQRLDDTVMKAWEQTSSIATQDTTLDVMFLCKTFPVPVYCHGSMLTARSSFFKQMFNSDKTQQIENHADLDIRWINTTKSNKQNKQVLEIRIRKPISISAMILFLDYIYTDTYTHPMSGYYKQPPLSRIGNSSTGTMIQKDLIMLASIFGMELLHDSASLAYGNTPPPRLKADILHLLADQNSCDVILDLKDGHHMFCHEMVLRQRSPFFEALFEPGSIWMASRREQVSPQDPLVHVQMTHVSKELMQPLLYYLYADMDEKELFAEGGIGDMEMETPDEMMHYLIEVLSLADELLLTRLKRICERALVRFLKLRTASHLLVSANLYLANWLKDSCLDFIAANLDIFLTSGMLKDIDSQVIQELERYVRWCQAYQLPSVRNVMLSSPSPITDEDNVDEEFEASLYTLLREDMPIVSSYYEKLITVLPETPSPSTPKSEEDEGVFAMDEDHAHKHPTSKKKSISLNESNNKGGKQQQQQTVNNDDAGGATRTDINSNVSNTSWQGWAPTPAMSLGSVESKVSLRDVLEQHSKPSELASTPPSSFGKSPPHIPKKLSQKERRKLQQQEIAAAAAVAATPKPVWGKIEAAVPIPPASASSKAGAISSSPVLELAYPSLTPAKAITKDGGLSSSSTSANTNVNNGSSSKQTSMKKDVVNKEVEGDRSKGKKIYISREELDDTLSQHSRRFKEEEHEDDGLFKPEISLGSRFTFTPIRRKHGITRQNSQGQPAQYSFQAIQKQQEQEDLWIKGKQARKNLIQIQAEEQAMDGLQQFYIQALDAKSGDWFEVNRLET